MKIFYVLSLLTLVVALFSTRSLFAQEGDCRTIGCHLIITDDTQQYSSCRDLGNPIEDGDEITVTVRAANLASTEISEIYTYPLDPSTLATCPPMRIRVTSDYNGNEYQIGLSGIVDHFEACTIFGIPETCSNEQLFCKEVPIEIDIASYCIAGGISGGQAEIPVKYRVVTADPVNGTYPSYEDINPECFTKIFPESCFIPADHNDDGTTVSRICLGCGDIHNNNNLAKPDEDWINTDGEQMDETIYGTAGNPQEYNGGTGGGDHIVISDDRGEYGNCNYPINHEDVIEVEVRSANLQYVQGTHTYEIPFPCPSMRLKITTQNDGYVYTVGVSDILVNWKAYSGYIPGSCTNTPIFKKTANVEIDIEDYCTNAELPSDIYKTEVSYEIVTANPVPETGEYRNYKDVSPTCFSVIFPTSCFEHGDDSDGAQSSDICFDCSDYGTTGGSLSGAFPRKLTNEKLNDSPSLHDDFDGLTIPYPNPFANALSLDYQIEKTQELQVVLYNVKGQRLLQQQFTRAAGSGTLTLPTYDLAPGIYLCKFWDGSQFQTFRVLKADQ